MRTSFFQGLIAMSGGLGTLVAGFSIIFASGLLAGNSPMIITRVAASIYPIALALSAVLWIASFRLSLLAAMVSGVCLFTAYITAQSESPYGSSTFHDRPLGVQILIIAPAAIQIVICCLAAGLDWRERAREPTSAEGIASRPVAPPVSQPSRAALTTRRLMPHIMVAITGIVVTLPVLVCCLFALTLSDSGLSGTAGLFLLGYPTLLGIATWLGIRKGKTGVVASLSAAAVHLFWLVPLVITSRSLQGLGLAMLLYTLIVSPALVLALVCYAAVVMSRSQDPESGDTLQ